MAGKRLHAAGGAMTAVHQIFELAMGTGVIGQAQAGMPGAIAASVALDGGWIMAARRENPPERLLAFLSGIAMGVPLVHFTLWPWTAKGGIPRLTEAEGLPDRLLPAYNAVLYAWFLAGLGAAVRETRRRDLPFVALGLLAIAGFRSTAQEHFRWIEREGQRNPRWWNRAWAADVV